MHQRLIQAAAQFAACTHPAGSVGSLVLHTPGDTLDPTEQEPTGAAWCQRCGSLRLGGSWRATLLRFEVTVAAGAALAEDDSVRARLDEARVCTGELARVLRETAAAPVTANTCGRLEALARSAEELAEGWDALSGELAAPPLPLETIAMADAAVAEASP